MGHYCNVILRSYAKDIMDSKIHKTAPSWKEIKFTVKKNKIPMVAYQFGFKMLLMPYNGLPVGYVDYKTQLINHAKEYGYIINPDKKWMFDGEQYKTLTAITEKIYGDDDIRIELESQLAADALAQIDECVLHDG